MAVAETLGVSRSNLIEQLAKQAKPRSRYHKAGDEGLLAEIKAIVDERPTYGYRRVSALVNRKRRAEGLESVNHKRVYRVMKHHNLLLARHTAKRPTRVHDGKVVTIVSNFRWCSDGFEFTCWNGDIIRGGFVIDAHAREAIAWRAAANAGISGSDVRDMMLESVEKRFGEPRAPNTIEFLSDNGSPYTAAETQKFAGQVNLVSHFTPVASPESNGVAEAFVKTFKRDYVDVNPLPDAETVLPLISKWMEDYNENHPHSGLKMRSPREYLNQLKQTA